MKNKINNKGDKNTLKKDLPFKSEVFKNIYNLYTYNFEEKHFYYLNATGFGKEYGNNEEKFYKFCLELGNAFLTKEEMIEEMERRKAKSRILKFCYDNNITLADSFFLKNIHNPKYYIVFDIKNQELVIERSQNFLYNIDFIFKNKSEAEKVLLECKRDFKIYFKLGEVRLAYIV